MKEKDVELGFVLKLERGESVIDAITDFCARRGIRGAVFNGIGAIERIQIGYYDLEKREYFWRAENDPHEVASMQGNVALVERKPFCHVHAVLSKSDATCAAIGGHIKEAYVAVTLEVFLTPLPVPLSREIDESIGLKLLNI